MPRFILAYGSILQAVLSGGRGFRRFNVPRLSTNSVRLMCPIFLKELWQAWIGNGNRLVTVNFFFRK
ncbi:hypothetical protein CYD30_24670 [Kosakonia cowanii]|nr:hypothetical protein CYD30_24670 [Kosakonia cowanii]